MKQWIKMIHVAKAKTGIDEEAYRAILAGAAGVGTAKEITTSVQYDQVMRAFRALGFRSSRRRTVEPQGRRAANMMTERQERYIRGLWELASRAKDERSLRAICRRISGVDDLSFCSKGKASALILALRDIARKAGFDPDGGS